MPLRLINRNFLKKCVKNRSKNNFFNLKKSFFATTYKGIQYTPIIMPKLSPTATESKIDEWLVEEGDEIEAGDSYCSVETDKASVSHDAQEDGYIAKIFKNDDKISINTLIGIQVENKDDIEKFKSFTLKDYKQNGEKTETSKKNSKITDKSTKTEKTKENIEISENKLKKENIEVKETLSERKFITPLAGKIAKENEINVSNITGTGRYGAIIANDIKPVDKNFKPKSSQNVNVSGEIEFEDIPLTPMRATIARRLLESKQQIPHFNLTTECDVSELLKLRKKLNEKENTKISVNDMIIKAAAISLREVKEVNSSFREKSIRMFKNIDISVAVTTPTGLLTPIVKSADKKGLSQISLEMKDMAKRARDGKLKPEEFIGGTFSISNLGMMGITNFSAIINPPQSAILAVGTTKENIILKKDGSIGKKMVLTVNLACDHRTVDGAVAANWLKVFRTLMEKPFEMLL